MKTKQTYSVEFKEQAILKVLRRGDRTLEAVAGELNVNVWTLGNWMKSVAARNWSSRSEKVKHPDDWSPAERLLALQESHGRVDEGLKAWCRERGLFAHDPAK